MQCAHCLLQMHPIEQASQLGRDTDGAWAVITLQCPACKRFNVILERGTSRDGYRGNGRVANAEERMLVYPKAHGRTPCPSEVPDAIAEDHTEACLVLADSPKASAALSRRCLQNVLREAQGVKHGNLYDEIEEAIKSGSLPGHISEALHTVRAIGNFAAHPTKSQTTGEIVPVELGEAEWNLDVLETLFDFCYVQPAKLAEKKAALDTKLRDAGRPALS